MDTPTQSRAWALFSELLEGGFERSLSSASLRASYYVPGRGGELIFDVVLQPIERFGLADIKRVTELVEKHHADLTIAADGFVIHFPPEQQQ